MLMLILLKIEAKAKAKPTNNNKRQKTNQNDYKSYINKKKTKGNWKKRGKHKGTYLQSPFEARKQIET